MASLREVAARVRTSPYVGALMAGGSMVAAGAYLASSFGMSDVLAAISRANVWLLAVVFGLGALVQIVRAERARWMLAHDRVVTLGQSYGPMVVGHGIGDLLPLAPGGPVLRCALTERLTGIPIAFSAGVYLLEGMFDGLGPSLLAAYLLLILAVPAWTRWMLLVALLQSAVFLAVPLLHKALPRWRQQLDAIPVPGGALHAGTLPLRAHRRYLAGLLRLGGQLAAGLATILTRGPRLALSVTGLSLLVTALGAVQQVIFLRAFGLAASVNDLLLLLVLTLAAGSLPIKIPGAGTVATTAALAVAGIHGPGVAGFVLVSRVVFSSETAVLALALLGWWNVRRSHQCDHGGAQALLLLRTASTPR